MTIGFVGTSKLGRYGSELIQPVGGITFFWQRLSCRLAGNFRT